MDISSFEGNNLIFVDEGHRGFKGKKWKNIRDEISAVGFTFEYSATFNEAIPDKDCELLEEYAKSIIMDYSYSHFYKDGFGKDFTVLNIAEAGEQGRDYRNRMFLVNLLSYYQQLKFYEEQNANLFAFSFEKPLWIFVGNSVSSGTKDRFDTDTQTDVQTVVMFLHNFLSERVRYVSLITEIINEENPPMQPVQGLEFITNGQTPDQIYDEILNLVFHSELAEGLKICTLNNAPGEICLKASSDGKYFALIYIGDVSNFKKRFSGDLQFQDDRFANSYFSTINDAKSSINILIGSKKFTEGWNSFRVSALGLLNMGKKPGSQIIQLFGRGVRLKGYKNLMKRSKALVSDIKRDGICINEDIKYLETLNIFGICANYVKQFRSAIQDEKIVEKEMLSLPIRQSPEFLGHDLVDIKPRNNDEFSNMVDLCPDESIDGIEINMTPIIESFSSVENNQNKARAPGIPIDIHPFLDDMDWDMIYFKLYDFKQQKMFYNLYFSKEILKKIIEVGNHRIVSNIDWQINTIERLKSIEDVCVQILQKYVMIFYNRDKKDWITRNLEYGILDENHENFQNYDIIADRNSERIREIRNMIANADGIYQSGENGLHRIVFDRHLYQPLIIKQDDITTIPTGLNDGEQLFIDNLRTYFQTSRDKLKDIQFFILRNLSRRGIGFFAETDNFYPDFILWAKKGKQQKITFIDPKGLLHAPAEQCRKIRMHETLKSISDDLAQTSEIRNVELTSIIIAGIGSTMNSLRGMCGMNDDQAFFNNHVVFQRDNDYIDKIMQMAIPTSN